MRNDEQVVDEFKARENIVALFKNKGGHKLDAGSTDWTLSKVVILPHRNQFALRSRSKHEQKETLLGTIIDGKRLSPTPVSKWNPMAVANELNQDLTVPCYP